MAWSYPAQESDGSCVLCVPVHLVPLVAYSFRDAQQRYKWDSEDDWQAGYYAFAALLGGLMNGCNIGESINELNVMLAHALGLREQASAAEVATFLPATGAALQAAEAADTGNKLTDLSRLASEQDLLDLRGQFPDSWFGFKQGDHVTLKDVMDNFNIGVVDDNGTEKNLWDFFLQSVGLTSDGAVIFDEVSDVIGSIIGSGGKAAVSGVNAGMQMASLVLMSSMAAHLKHLSAAITGNEYRADLAGGVPPPITLQQANEPYRSDHAYERLLKVIEALRGDSATADNILQALRGDVQASAARNVIDRIPDLTTIETALAALDTSQQATTSAINGLTLSADNITIDVTTLETRLDSLIDQVERLRGVTADSAAANVDDVFQELDGLRADVATLMSTADSSSFMQIVDIVQSVNAAQKEVVTFRKAFSNTEFCCDDTVYSPPTEPDDTTAPQASHCQRVQWLRDAAQGVIAQFQKFVIDGKLTKLNDATVASLYQTRFGVAMDSIKLPYFARMIRNIATWGTDNLPENFPYPEMANGYLDTLWNYFVEIESFSFSTDIDGNTISSQKGFLCAMYDAQTPLEAYQNWQTSLQAYFGARLSGNSPLDSDMYWVLLNMMGGALLDGIFAGTIPTDPAELTGYDNTVCAGCISSSGGCQLIGTSEPFTGHGASGQQAVDMPTTSPWPSYPWTSSNSNAGYTYSINRFCTLESGIWENWWVRVDKAGVIDSNTLQSLPAGTWVRLTNTTNMIAIRSTSTSIQFTLEMCPPDESPI